jgi:tRNA 2-thiouridine synthesizing protein D
LPKNFLLFLCESPFQHESAEQVYDIAEAALKKGHKISVFVMMDGVYNPVISQNGAPFNTVSISEKISILLKKGVKIAACRVCMELRGVDEKMYPEGVIAGGLFDLSEMIAGSNVVLNFNGRQ